MSKCYFCKIGEIAPGLVSSTTVLDSLIVLTKEVPAKVCGRCGEEYYDREVVSRLEEITDEAKRLGVETLVSKYDDGKSALQRVNSENGAADARNHKLRLSAFPVSEEKNCFLCRNDELKPGVTSTSITRGDAAVVVKGVPAMLCTNCGESYLTPDVSKLLKEDFKDAEKTGVEFMVRKYIPAKVECEEAGKPFPHDAP